MPGIEYTNSTVDAIYHAEGRAVKDGSTWDHEYVITDHLGNTRVRFHDDNGNGTISSGELLSTHDYYPFGMEWNAGSYQYTYNGKERNDELGLELFDYGARMYDPAIARWGQVDPLSDDALQVDKTPFAYAWGNPIRYDDPDGKCPSCVGAAAGGAIDYGLQVAENLLEGKSFKKSLTDVDGTEIAVSAGLGATGVGLISKARKLFRIGKKVIKVVTRTTRQGKKGVRIKKKSGEVKDITEDRVKEYLPEPRNPKTGQRQVNYNKEPNKIPKGSKVIDGSKGKKRTPTKKEIKQLRQAKDKNIDG